MAKKKSRNSKNNRSKNRSRPNRATEGRVRLPARLAKELPKAQRLLAQGRQRDGIELLEALNRRFPNQPVVLHELVNASLEIEDYRSYLQYIRRLYAVQRNPDTLSRLATAYVVNQYPFAGMRYYEEFLERYPDHEEAATVRSQLTKLVDISGDMLDNFANSLVNDSEAERKELAFRHDLLRAAVESIEIDEARKVGAELLERYPGFVPALNNLSQIEHLAGNISAAIELTEQVLEKEPNNFQAVGNLTRYLYLSGQVEAAKEKAEVLKSIQSEDPDILAKKAEAFTYVADDQAVLETVESAESADLEGLATAPLFYHLGGVAAARLGNPKQAKSLWRKALLLSPNFSIAKRNLDDIGKKSWEQNGPWPFSAQQWLQSSYMSDMREMLVSGELAQNANRPAAESLKPYLDENPHVIRLMAILLERGDDEARTIVIQLARFSEYPELVELVKEFALSQTGSDEQRLNALHAMTEIGVISAGMQELWMRGEWTEILTMGFEIGEDADVNHPFKSRKAMQKMEQSTILMQEDRDEEALKLLEEAYELEPDNPGIINNLVGTRQRVTGDDNVRGTLEQLTRDFPDYLFGHTGLANIYTLEKNFDKAHEHLNPLLQRKKLHYSEFRALAISYIRLSMAEEKP